MAPWCPLFGPLDPAWPGRPTAIIYEARRILGVKRVTKERSFDSNRLALIRDLFDKAPEWLEYRAHSRTAATSQPVLDRLAFALETKTAVPPPPQDARTAVCVLAIYQARRACIEQSAAALVDSDALLVEAHALGQRQSFQGAIKGGTEGKQEVPEWHDRVLAEARRLLANGKPSRGLSGEIARALRRPKAERQIRRILTDNGIWRPPSK